MESIKYGRTQISYTVRRSKRKKTVAINVASPARVVVLSPLYLSPNSIKDIVRKKAGWIIDKQDYFTELEKLFPDKEFVSGEEVLISGRAYRLKVLEVMNSHPADPHLVGRRIVVSVNRDFKNSDKIKYIKKSLIGWYYSRAEKITRQRARRYEKLLNVSPRELKIKDQKSRWASCSKAGILRFNWRIAMLPISLIDYIIAHELCHLKINNHSPKFWRMVSLVIPDYKERRESLKKYAGIFKY